MLRCDTHIDNLLIKQAERQEVDPENLPLQAKITHEPRASCK